MRSKIDVRRSFARWWLVAAMLGAIGVVLGGAVWSAARERDAILADFSHRQALLATAVGADFENRLADSDPASDDLVPELLAGARRLEAPRDLLVLVARPGAPGFLTSDERVIPSMRVRVALDGNESSIVIPRDEAVGFGLPRRTAVAGLARVSGRDGRRWGVVVIASAQRVRDRQIQEQWRLAITVLIATGVAVAFGTVERRRQRAELEREREAALTRAEKMAAVAALSTGIAHELGTPLGVIVGRVEQVMDRTSDERTRSPLKTVLEQVERMRAIVRGYLALARGDAPLLVQASPASLSKRAVELVRHRFDKAGVALEHEVTSNIPDISCDPPLFEQALVNVLLNACEASPRGARVTLRVRYEESRVEFLVDDEGPGISEDVARLATTPFFSTRREQGGSGLGLTIAREIVGHHAGVLTLETRRDAVGTRARIRIGS